jgi:ADP-ribose pyrophosphatase YjhB (NUDIX family)
MSNSSDKAGRLAETSPVLRWSDRLRSIAQTGLAFNPDGYEAERCQEILKVAAEMAAAVQADGHDAVEHTVRAWSDEVRPGIDGYVTPKVGAEAVVFNAQGQLLLMQRADSGMWYLPCGWADVGYTPAAVAVKEVLEETGLRVTPLQVLAVLDSWRARRSRLHFYNVTFGCRLDGGSLRPHPLEALDVGFFAEDRLPRPLRKIAFDWVGLAFSWRRGELKEAYFDR